MTCLNGKKYYLNPHLIESMECRPDLTLTLITGKTVIVREKPEEIIEKIISYRQKLGINVNQES